METIVWEDFEAVLLCAGTVLSVEEFPEARKPAYIVTVDFGPHGVKRTSARITALYAREDLVGRQILGVINFPPKQIGSVRSEFLLTGFVEESGKVVLAVPERQVSNGIRLL